MSAFVDLTGMVFGRLTVLGVQGRKGRRYVWLCRCECGKEHATTTINLRSGDTRSCGCLWAESVRENGMRTTNLVHRGPAPRHGHARKRRHTREYWTWHGMIQRCTNPNSARYRHYGGRGIKVCERWMVFDNFLADMGKKPLGLTIDRINVNGDYEPGNCRWATMAQQAMNKQVHARRALQKCPPCEGAR